jgi:hypothetical protein
MMHSPLTLVIAIEYAVSGEPGANIPSNIWNSPATKSVKEWLFDNYLIDSDTADAKPTQKLHAWLEALCAVPLPIKRWVSPIQSEGGDGDG